MWFKIITSTTCITKASPSRGAEILLGAMAK